MKISKKILSLVLSVVMVVGTLTATPIFATENVCHIGSTYYTSLEDALNAYNNKTSTQTKTIELDADCEINNNVSLKKVDYTINGNGHVICTDTANSTSTYKTRGIQTNSSAVLTINNATMTVSNSCAYSIFQYAGVVTCNNVTFMDSSKEAIYFHDNTNVHTLTLNGCTFAEFSTTPLLINVANAIVTIKDTTFSDNTGDYDVDYTLGTSLSIGGTSTINKLHLASGKTIEPLSDLDSSSYIGLYLEITTEGTQVLTGDNIATKYSAFKIPGYSNLSVGSNGQIKAKKVAKWNGTEYNTLADAVAALNADTGSVKTIYLIDDADVPERITISRSGVTITDDGTPRTIYVHNGDTSSTGGYGRGFQMQLGNESYTVTFKGTKAGNLTIVGHNEDETEYNGAHIFAVRGGELILNNVIVKECINSAAGSDSKLGGVIKCQLSSATARGSATIVNTEIYDCQAAAGAAIYSVGGDVTLTNTNIHDCACTGDSGAIAITDEPGSVTSDLSHDGNLYLYAGVIIKDNYKTTTLEQKTSGALGNVSVEDGTQITIKANQSTCNIGIDYGSEGDVFAINTGKWGGTMGSLHRDGDNSLTAKRDTSTNMMYWMTYSYEINWGEYTTVSTSNVGVTTYKYPSATVTAENGAAVSVAVDRGSFEIDWSELSLANITSYEAVLADGTFASGTMPTTGTVSYKGITLYGTITNKNAATLIKALVFTNTGSGIAQNITFGMAEALEDGEQYFAGSKYYYYSDAKTWDNANLDATNSLTHLVYIEGQTENDYVNGISNVNVWTGAAQKLNAWYWNNGTKFGANASTNEGYNGSYVNWKAGEPSGDGERIVIDANGKWVNKDANDTSAYITEREDSSKVVNSVSIAAAVTTSLLSSMNLSFNGDITMYYYFLFADDVKAQDNYKVVVEVGSGDDKFTVSSTIAEMANLKDSQGNYGIKVPVPAKMMGADVKIRLCNASGNSIRSYANYDGAHPEKNYNCLYYANYMYAQQADRYNQYYSEDLIAMITAMLNYGAAAQQQFGYDTKNLVNAGHEDTTPTMEYIPTEDIIKYSGTNFTDAYLVADSQTLVGLDYTGSGTEPTVTIGGVATTNFTFENKTLKIPVSAQNLGKAIEVTIGNDYAILNANYVLNEILIGGYSDAQKLTCDRLYKFGKAADQYFGIYAQNTNAVEAVLETAYAYLAKETYSQYDQTSIDSVPMAGDYPQGRRQLFATPEEMSADHSVYMDCSSFCYSVYRNIYGAEATRSAFLTSDLASYSNLRTYYMTYYPNQASVVKTYTNLATDTWYQESDKSQYIANWTATVEDAKSIMQPGDVISYYGKNSSGTDGGHIVMWTGSGFIHCTGSSYNSSTGVDSVEPNGAVHFISPSEFNYTYLMKHGAEQAVILRPLNVLASKGVSDSAVARTQLGAIAVEATGYDNTNSQELYQGQYVVDGDSVTYTITITNKQMKGNLAVNKNVDVVYTPSTYLTSITVQNGGVYDADLGTITWSDVEVGVDQTVKLTFAGTVDGEAKEILYGGDGAVSLSDAGTVAKALWFGAMDAEIETYSASSLQTKVNYVKDYPSKFVGDDGAATVNKMLQYITGDNTVSIGVDDAAVKDVIRTVTSLGNYRPASIGYWQSNIVSNFCGGNKFFMNSIDEGPFSNVERVRNIKVENLKVGDIIMTYRSSSSSTDYYVYVGGDDLSKNMVAISSSLNTSPTSAATICERLNGRSLWGIFRLTK